MPHWYLFLQRTLSLIYLLWPIILDSRSMQVISKQIFYLLSLFVSHFFVFTFCVLHQLQNWTKLMLNMFTISSTMILNFVHSSGICGSDKLKMFSFEMVRKSPFRLFRVQYNKRFFAFLQVDRIANAIVVWDSPCDKFAQSTMNQRLQNVYQRRMRSNKSMFQLLRNVMYY